MTRTYKIKVHHDDLSNGGCIINLPATINKGRVYLEAFAATHSTNFSGISGLCVHLGGLTKNSSFDINFQGMNGILKYIPLRTVTGANIDVEYTKDHFGVEMYDHISLMNQPIQVRITDEDNVNLSGVLSWEMVLTIIDECEACSQATSDKAF